MGLRNPNQTTSSEEWLQDTVLVVARAAGVHAAANVNAKALDDMRFHVHVHVILLHAEFPLARNVFVLQVEQRRDNFGRVLGGHDLLLPQHDVVCNRAPHIFDGHVLVHGNRISPLENTRVDILSEAPCKEQ